MTDHNNQESIDRSVDSSIGQQHDERSTKCPFIDTVDRRALDFDFEKLCSVTLSKINVYACLVCGKYFQGRGRSTHAFIHSVGESHHVFLNLETLKFYCLPDNYEILEPSFKDIIYVLRPRFTKSDIDDVDKLEQEVKAYDGKTYWPGIVGLNNLKYNDYCNVIFQAMSHVKPLRDYFLLDSNHSLSRLNDDRYLLRIRFGELIRKLWNPNNFKAHVSPHEMLQAIVLSSKKRFEFTRQSDPIVFLGWFLNSIMGPKREKESVIHRSFQGKIRIMTRLLLPNVAVQTSGEPELIASNEETMNITSFLYLTLDLPTMPLFPKKDEKGKVIKPRINIYELLSKFDPSTRHEFKSCRESSIKRYEIIQLPRYIIIYYRRFTKNTFFTEKNTHIVDFPLIDLDLTNLTGTRDTKSPTLERAKQAIHDYYNLIVNIVHDGEPEAGRGTYRTHIYHDRTGKWFEIQDLYVTEVTDKTLITLSETYIQIWARKGSFSKTPVCCSNESA